LAGEHRGGPRRHYERSEPTHHSAVVESPDGRAGSQSARPGPVYAHSKHQPKRYGKPRKPAVARKKSGYNGKARS
jgi:hypothetical protein